MKSSYINPEVMILALASEDVITTSSPVRLDQGEYGMPDLFGVEES